MARPDGPATNATENVVNTYSDATSIHATDRQTNPGQRTASSPAEAPEGNGTTGQVREMATDAAAAVGSQVKEMLDRQVGSGCKLVSTFARSAMRAADDLNRDAPQLAGLVRGAASRLDGVANDLHDQSVDQLMKSASDYTRRQPALVFGIAAAVGFLALRTVKNASSSQSPSSSGGTARFTSHDA